MVIMLSEDVEVYVICEQYKKFSSNYRIPELNMKTNFMINYGNCNQFIWNGCKKINILNLNTIKF